jgi:hypothetical protein
MNVEFGRFTEFARRLFAVPHAEIKTKLDARKRDKRAPRVSASRATAVSSKMC